MSAAKTDFIKTDFAPAKQFERYYLIFNICAAVALSWLCLVWLVIPFYDTGFDLLIVYLAVITLIPVIFIAFWNRLYYRTIVYHLNETEMTWKRGVWFKQTGIVPYNRITNIDIVQGPLMRMFKISNLRIQTAGYSAQKNAEIKIQGIEDAEMLRELIMDYVRNKAPAEAATGGDEKKSPKDSMVSAEILAELKDIKDILKTRL